MPIVATNLRFQEHSNLSISSLRMTKETSLNIMSVLHWLVCDSLKPSLEASLSGLAF